MTDEVIWDFVENTAEYKNMLLLFMIWQGYSSFLGPILLLVM